MNHQPLPEQLNEVITLAENIFSGHLAGIYLYGSATLGRLRPESDLDILILVNRKMTDAMRKNFTQALLSLSHPAGSLPQRPLEVTVIHLPDILPWKFPPLCEYLYGEWLRETIAAGKLPQAHSDPDLTILLWQAEISSLPLRGEDIRKFLPAIPFSQIKQSMRDSLPDLLKNYSWDQRNVLLTLARMWYTLETESICTKDAAAAWAISRLPARLVPLMEMAGDAYLGNIHEDWNAAAETGSELVLFFQQQIERLLR